MDRTMVITGKGKVSANPDLAIIRFPVENYNMRYSNAVKELNSIVNQLRKALVQLGIEKENIKTRDFKVDNVTEYDKVRKAKIIKGYNAQHDLVLEIPLDNKLINQIINKVSEIDETIAIQINFSVREKEEYLQRLLQNAFEEAKKKASIIAESSGISLKEIVNINYSFSDIYFISETSADYNSIRYDQDYSADLNPKDIDMSENVTITWRIE